MTILSSSPGAHQPFFGSARPRLKLRYAEHSPAVVDQLRRDNAEAQELRKSSQGSTLSPISPSAAPNIDVFIPRTTTSPIADTSHTTNIPPLDEAAIEARKQAKAKRKAEKKEIDRLGKQQRLAVRIDEAREELKAAKEQSLSQYIQNQQNGQDLVTASALPIADLIKREYLKHTELPGLFQGDNAPSKALYERAKKIITAAQKKQEKGEQLSYEQCSNFYDAIANKYDDFINTGYQE